MSDSLGPTSAHVGQPCIGLTGKALPRLPGPPSHVPAHPRGSEGLPGAGDSRTRELLLSTRCSGRETQPCPNSRPFQGTRYPRLPRFRVRQHHKRPLPGSRPGWAVQERQE